MKDNYDMIGYLKHIKRSADENSTFNGPFQSTVMGNVYEGMSPSFEVMDKDSQEPTLENEALMNGYISKGISGSITLTTAGKKLIEEN